MVWLHGPPTSQGSKVLVRRLSDFLTRSVWTYFQWISFNSPSNVCSLTTCLKDADDNPLTHQICGSRGFEKSASQNDKTLNLRVLAYSLFPEDEQF